MLSGRVIQGATGITKRSSSPNAGIFRILWTAPVFSLFGMQQNWTDIIWAIGKETQSSCQFLKKQSLTSSFIACDKRIENIIEFFYDNLILNIYFLSAQNQVHCKMSVQNQNFRMHILLNISQLNNPYSCLNVAALNSDICQWNLKHIY